MSQIGSKVCEGRFSAKSSEEKLKFVRDRKLFENCLSYTHFASGCKSPRACSVDQCSISCKHLTSLHDAALASFRRRKEDIANKDLVLDRAQVLRSPKVITLL